MAEYVVAQAAVLIVPTLDGFQAKMEKELREMQRKALEITVTGNTKPLHAQVMAEKQWLEKQRILLNATVDAKQLTEIRHKYEDLQREFKKGLLLDLKVAGLNLLPQVASGLAAVNAAMVELAQSSVLLPGIISGVLSSVGSLATGLSGVKAAFKEYSDAQKNAAQNGLQARNAALNVQNAYRDMGRAIKDAQRNLEDLNAQLRDAPLDEADAIIRVQEAISEAADKAGKSGLQQQKDALAVIKAENQLADVRMRNSRLVQDAAEANAKGVAGADNVREATDRLSKAQDDANTKLTKLSDSLKQLSPNAQSFVTTITGLASTWSDFKMSTQDRLFAGLDTDITKLAQTTLPTVKKGFGEIADALNGNVKAAFSALRSETNTGFLDNIFGNTAKAQGNISNAIDPLIDGFLRLSSASSNLLPRLTDGLTDLLRRFDSFVATAEADGSLDKWMNNGIEALKQLGNSIINVGSILTSLQEAFVGSGGTGLLGTIEGASEKMAEFFRSAEGQQKLQQFFKTARDELRQWKPVLDELPNLFANVSAAGKQWADFLLPFLTTAARMLGEHPLLVQTLFTAYMTWKNVAPVIKGVGGAFKSVTDALQDLNAKYPSFGEKTDAVKTKIGNLATALGPSLLLTAVTTAVTWIGTNMVRAHDDAAAAAQRQKRDVDDLTRSLTDVTGAATAATSAMVAKNFREGNNAGTGTAQGNALAKVLPDVTKQNEVVNKVVAGDLQGALAMVPGATVRDVEATPMWNDKRQQLEAAGITSQVLADALNGQPEAVKKYEEYYRQAINPMGLPDDVARGIYNSTPHVGDAKQYSLLDVQGQLPEMVKQGSIAQGQIYANTQNIITGRTNKVSDNTVGQGRFKLNTAGDGIFSGLGVTNGPGVGGGGEGEIVARQALSEQQLNALSQDGVTMRQDGPDRFIYTFSPKAVEKYFQKYATGGLISGPGSGTSDSILARLSHGEYVVNAASTQKHLPLLEKINRGEVPGFAGGGSAYAAGKMPFLPQNPAPTPPVVPDIAPMSQPDKPTPSPGGTRITLGGASDAPMSGTMKIPQQPSKYGIPTIGNPSQPLGTSISGWLKDKGRSFGNWLENHGVANDLGSFFDPPKINIVNKPNVEKSAYHALYPGWDGGVLGINLSGDNRPLPTSQDPKRVSFGDFLGQVTSNIKGDYLPYNKSASPAPAPKSPAVPPVTPKPNDASSPASGSAGAPAKWVPGKGWQDSAGNSVPGPGATAEQTSAFNAGSATHGAGSGTTAVPSVVPVAGPGNMGPGPGNFGPGTGNAALPALPALPAVPTALPAPTIGALPPGFTPTPVPAQNVDGVIAEVNYGAQEAAKYGLTVSSGLRPGDKGFHGSGHAGDYTNQKQFGPPTPEMTAFANDVLSKYVPYIDELIYSGVPQNIYKGQLVPAIDMPNSPYNTDQAGYHGDHVHIAWKPGALQQLQQAGLLPPGMAGSPSNMPLAMTPTGVGLPQLTYTDPNADPNAGGNSIDLGIFGKIKIPTPEEYAKSVTDSWMSTIDNLVKNSGQIAIKFLGSFFGLDFSSILGNANSALSDIGLGKSGDGKGKSDSNQAAIPGVDWIIQNKDNLPPGYADQLLQYAQQNPAGAQDAIAKVKAALGVGGAGGSNVQYNPSGGAEQWRPIVRQALAQVATKYGINNLSAWEDDIVGQINLESRGNPNIDNLNDSDGKGGTQQVFGLGQFHPDTFRAHNVTGGDIHDPVAQIYAMIDYLASPKYGVIPNGGVNWKGNGWRNGKGYADGGKIMGEGSQTSDSILARVSNGEYIVKASAAQKNLGLLNAINAGKLPGFADGMLWPVGAPAPVTPPPPPPVTTPDPAATPVVPDPMGPIQSVEAGVPAGPTPDGAPDPNAPALAQAGAVLGGIGDAAAGIAGGAQAPAGGTPEGDPRSVLMGAPQNLDHNNPAIAKGVEAAAGVIQGAVSMAVQAGAMAANAQAPGAGQGVSSAAGIIQGLVSTGTSAVTGAVNILSSLGVGTLTPGSTAGAYGTPLLPDQAGQKPYTGPSVVNNFNGGVHTSNNEEFYKIQQRRELQNASPFLPQR